MARTATPAGDTAAREAAAAEAAAAADGKPDGFDWSTLAAPVVMDTKQGPGGIKVNVLETVPAPIRQRAEASLTINVERVKAKPKGDAKRARVNYHWELQQLPDAATGEQFIKLITKYAKYRPVDGDIPYSGPTSPKGQVTARTGSVNHYRKDSADEYVICDANAAGATLGVRYSVRPFEQRSDTARVPGSAS